MKGIREIKNRIRAVQNTGKITRAMQLVAASKMKKAQDKAKAGRPYAFLLAEILYSLLQKSEDLKHPFLEERQVKHRGLVLISSDKGLCGPLNSNVFKLTLEIDKQNTRFISIGRKAKQFLVRNGYNLIADFSLPDNFSFSQAREPSEFLIKAFLEKEIDTIEVLFPRFLNTLIQKPMHEKLLPFSNLHEELVALKERLGAQEETQASLTEDKRGMLFEPNVQSMLAELPFLFIKEEIYQMILEAKASEHSARMVAMKTATDNAKELVNNLKLEYNKARQAAITQEILELAAGMQQSAQ